MLLAAHHRLTQIIGIRRYFRRTWSNPTASIIPYVASDRNPRGWPVDLETHRKPLWSTPCLVGVFYVRLPSPSWLRFEYNVCCYGHVQSICSLLPQSCGRHWDRHRTRELFQEREGSIRWHLDYACNVGCACRTVPVRIRHISRRLEMDILDLGNCKCTMALLP